MRTSSAIALLGAPKPFNSFETLKAIVMRPSLANHMPPTLRMRIFQKLAIACSPHGVIAGGLSAMRLLVLSMGLQRIGMQLFAAIVGLARISRHVMDCKLRATISHVAAHHHDDFLSFAVNTTRTRGYFPLFFLGPPVLIKGFHSNFAEKIQK